MMNVANGRPARLARPADRSSRSRCTLPALLSLVFLSCFLAAQRAMPAEPAPGFVVVVHSSNAASSVPKDQLSRLFLKRTTRWADGTTALPVDLPEPSPVRQSFSRAVHGRDVAAIRSYWQQQIFAGRAVPPPELQSDAAVLRFVAQNPGAVGYVSKGTPTSDVKVVTVQ